MKNTLALFGIVGLTTILFSSNAMAQKEDKTKDSPKTRHIKMTKIENGKKMELDTIISGNDIFVWHGDTIGGKEMGKHISSSGRDHVKQIKVVVDGDEKNENVMIYHSKDGKNGEPMIWQMESSDDVQVFNETEGDSVNKKIIIRKRIKDGDKDQFIYLNEPNMKHFPPMPPMPPMPHRKMLRGGQDNRVIDLNDPNIVSYKKKDLKGDLEKIEIIRKKSQEPENMSFNFKYDDELMPPPPPDAAEIIKEFNNGEPKIKIIRKEKKEEGKNGKEIEVEVESKENK